MGNEDKIEIVRYRSEWKDWFEILSNIYIENLGDLVEKTEHVGSTAVEGMWAKPLIDIDLVIEDYAKFSEVKKKLFELGYDHEGDYGIEGREAFRRKDKKVPWDNTGRIKHEHNLYVCPKDSRELKRHISFRDHLKKNEKCRNEYNRLKKELARKYRFDREAYTEGKTKFIERILENIS